MNLSNLTKPFRITTWTITLCCIATASTGAEFSLNPFLVAQTGYEDNILQVAEENNPQKDFVSDIQTGIYIKAPLDDKTRYSARYETAFYKYNDFDKNNRMDHLLSLLFYRKLRHKLSLLAHGNIGLRSQPNDSINNYYKQSFAAQTLVQWNSLWLSQFGTQFRHKSYPYNDRSNYSSLMLEGDLGRRMGVLSQIRVGYLFRAYQGAIDPRVLQLKPGEKMKGIRQTASISFESMLSEKVLMNWKYQFELDIATKGLQSQTGFPRLKEQTGEFEGEYEDFDYDEDKNFNFVNHQVEVMLAWRLCSQSTMALYARHDSKFYSDWLIPMTNSQRHDNLTSLQIYLKQRLSSDLSLRLQYSLERNKSNDPMQRYTDNIYSIGLRYGF